MDTPDCAMPQPRLWAVLGDPAGDWHLTWRTGAERGCAVTACGLPTPVAAWGDAFRFLSLDRSGRCRLCDAMTGPLFGREGEHILGPRG